LRTVLLVGEQACLKSVARIIIAVDRGMSDLITRILGKFCSGRILFVEWLDGVRVVSILGC